MRFDWNDANIGHIALHKVTPEQAEEVIQNNPLDVGTNFRNGENRTLNLGETRSGLILVIVVTEREGMYRVVTARPANRKERTFYKQQKETTYDENEIRDS